MSNAVEAGSKQEFILEMRNIVKEFPGVKALAGVNLNVRPGTVHALMGENGAGKSTLMKCLFGLYRPDRGEIVLEGRPVQVSEPKVALAHGISMIHQELHPVPFRSVMENIWLGRFPTRGFGPFRLVNHGKMLRDTKALFEGIQIEIDPKTWVQNLSVSKIQSMEIAKAVSLDAKVIIMDEPTSSLTENEVRHLFGIMRRLRD